MGATSKRILLFALAALCHGAVWARSTAPREWTDPAFFPHLISFEPWQEPQPPSQYPLTPNFHVPTAPSHGLFGFATVGPVDEAKFPLRIAFYYGFVSAENVEDKARQVSDFKWGDGVGINPPLPAADAVQIRLIVPAGAPARVAVWNIPFAQPLMQRNPKARSVWMEVRDKNDKLVAYRCLIDAYFEGYLYGAGGPQAYTTEDAEAERFFNERNIGPQSRQSRLPEDWRFYTQVRAVWFSRQTLDQDLSRDFFRRLLLSGVSVVGRPETAAAVSQKAGLAPDMGVLNAAVSAFNDPDDPLRAFQAPSYAYSGDIDSTGTFVPRTSLAREPMRQLRNYTLTSLGIYAALLAAMLVSGFTWLKGRRRILLWVAAPCLSAAAAVLIWLLAPRAVDFSPKAQSVLFEYSWDDWADSYQESVSSFIDFSGGEFVWEFPPATNYVNTQNNVRIYYGRMQADERGYTISDTPVKSVLRLGTDRGHVAVFSAYSWGRNDPPCRPVDKNRWVFSENFEKAWAWTGAAWKDLGPVNAGDVKDVSQAPDLYNLAEFAKLYAGSHAGYQPMSQPIFNSLSERAKVLSDPRTTAGARMKNQGIIIGVKKSDGFPRPVWKKREGTFTGTSVRVHGFPLSGPFGKKSEVTR